MNYSFVLALVLSLVWHSFAFVLFKLAEPYNVKPETYETVNVDLIVSDQFPDQTLDSLKKIDFLDTSRFSLPSETGQQMPSPEINVDLHKKMSYLKTQPIYEKALIKHLPAIGEKIEDLENTDDLNKKTVDYTYPPEKSVNYFSKINKPAKTMVFSLKGTDRKPVEKFLPETKVVLSRPVVIRFSLDSIGNVKYAIIEKSSGTVHTDKIFLDSFKKWRFEKALTVQKLDIHRIDVQWGTVVFYLN